MLNTTNRIRIHVARSLFCFFCMLLLSYSPASASFKAVKSAGMLTNGLFKHAPKQKTTKKVNQYFSCIAPSDSQIGAVKSYVITNAETLIKKDWEQIQRINIKAFSTNDKAFFRPVGGRISSLFGARKHPITKRRSFHTGIDIAARRGTPILCGLAGKVTFAGWRHGYGYMVIVDHGNGYETYYAHCSKLLVKRGEIVNTGQSIAKVGSTGIATGAHLHFEVRKDGKAQNPFSHLLN